MKLLKLIALSAIVFMATVGASHGAPARAPAAILDAVPSKPTAICPTNGSVISLVNPPTNCTTWPTFRWKDNAPAGGYYDIEVATDPGFSAIIPGESSDSDHTSSCGLSVGTNYFNGNPADFLPTTTYYWRVQTYDSTCNVGTNDFTTGGSGWATFTFHTAIPATSDTTPNPRLPANNPYPNYLLNNLTNDVTNYPPEPMFQWNPVASATGYVLQVSQSPSFSSNVINVTLPYTKTSYSLTSDLPKTNTTYSWRVETLGGVYGNTWSDIWSFTTANQTPIPTLLQPATNNLDTDFTPGLLWKAVANPASTFVSYEVQAWTDKTFTNLNSLCFDVDQATVGYLASQDDGTSSTNPVAHLDVFDALASAPTGSPPNCQIWAYNSVNSLPSNTTIYWRVRAENSDGTNTFYSDWSSAFILRTAFQEVACDSTLTLNNASSYIIAPGPGTLLNNQPTFSWEPVPGSPEYNIQISRYPGFSSFVLNTTALLKGSPPVTYIPKTSLPPGVTLYWRVRASTPSYGPGLWSCPSTPFTFTTANQPSTPKPIRPALNALVHAATPTAPTLVWSASAISPSTTFANYEVEVATDTGFSSPVVDDTADATSQFVPLLTLSGIPGTPLNSATKYYWRVRAFDSLGDYSNWSAISSFSTEIDIPTGLANSGTSPMILTWNPVAGAGGYSVQITESPTFRTGIHYYSVHIPTLSFTAKSGTTWYWRVSAVSTHFGRSPFTDGTDTFTIP